MALRAKRGSISSHAETAGTPGPSSLPEALAHNTHFCRCDFSKAAKLPGPGFLLFPGPWRWRPPCSLSLQAPATLTQPLHLELPAPSASWPRKPPGTPSGLGLAGHCRATGLPALRHRGPAEGGGARFRGVFLAGQGSHAQSPCWGGQGCAGTASRPTPWQPRPLPLQYGTRWGVCNVVIETLLIASKWSLLPFD